MKHSPELPVYTGPEITYADGQRSSLRKAGPAPKGWKYLKVGDRVGEDAMVLSNSGWTKSCVCVGEHVGASSWLLAVPDQTGPEYIGSETDFLRLRVTKRNSKKVAFVIDTQRERGFTLFVAKNGVRIQSMQRPEIAIWRDPHQPITLFTRGDEPKFDTKALNVTPKQFEKIQSAVEELNFSKRKPVAPKIFVDWTCDSKGVVNSSPKFLELRDAVAKLIRESAHTLIAGRAEDVARLIVAQLAHKHGLAPKG